MKLISPALFTSSGTNRLVRQPSCREVRNHRYKLAFTASHIAKFEYYSQPHSDF